MPKIFRPGLEYFGTQFHLWHKDILRGSEDSGTSVPTLAVDNNQIFNHYVWQNPAALNDQLHHRHIYLNAGNYHIKHTYFRTTSNGDLTLYLYKKPENTFITIFDDVTLYGASLYNAVIEADFDVAATGEYRLVYNMTSVGAGGGYQHRATLTSIWKNASD